MTNHALCLVDVDSRRRAAIVHNLSTSGIHVEPFESVVELIRHRPRQQDVILAHDDGPVVSELMEQLVARGTWCPIVAYGEEPSVRRVVQAVQNGVEDYLNWPFSASDVDEALGKLRTNSARHSRSREIAARLRIDRLTRREREVLTRLADGLTNRGIAEQLQISPRTVEIHRANLLNKIQARHTSDAIRVAIEANLGD
jgi:two-component system, LuxR family, response regulator FixJ